MSFQLRGTHRKRIPLGSDLWPAEIDRTITRYRRPGVMGSSQRTRHASRQLDISVTTHHNPYITISSRDYSVAIRDEVRAFRRIPKRSSIHFTPAQAMASPCTLLIITNHNGLICSIRKSLGSPLLLLLRCASRVRSSRRASSPRSFRAGPHFARDAEEAIRALVDPLERLVIR